MTEQEIKQQIKRKISEHNLEDIDPESVPISKKSIVTTYNDGSKEEVDQLSEFYLCKKSFVYFANSYGRILDPKNKRISPLKLHEFQQNQVAPALINEKFIIFRKSRQIGISVLTGTFCIWTINFNIAQDVLAISKTMTDAQDYKQKAMVTYDHLPAFLTTSATTQNTTTLKLSNNSRLVVKAQSPDAGRGMTPSLVILDEAAFMPYAEEIWASVFPSLSVSNGGCFIISTSNGVGNFYHKTWTKAENGENDFFPIYVPWWEFPNRSNPWLEKIINKDVKFLESQFEQEELQDIKKKITLSLVNGEEDPKKDLYFKKLLEKFIAKEEEKALSYNGPKDKKPWLKKQLDNSHSVRKFNQEILSKFLGSGNTVVSTKRLEQIEKDVIEPILVNRLSEDKEFIKGIHVFEEPQEGVTYTMTCDVMTGAGDDYSTFIVVKDYNMEQVAEYKSQIDTKTFGQIIKETARFYNRAYVIIETNQGMAVFNEVFLSENDAYQNVFYEYKGRTYRGLHTKSNNRKLMVDELINNTEGGEFIIRSKRSLEELKVFVWENGKPQASKNYNDDLVLCWMFLGYIAKYGNQKTQLLGFATGGGTVDMETDNVSEINKLISEEEEYAKEESAKKYVEDNFGMSWEDYKMIIS